MSTGLLLLLTLLGAMAGIVCAWRMPRAWLVCTASAGLAGCAAAVSVFLRGAWDWQSDFLLGGEPLHVRLDAISAFFLVLLSVLGMAGTLYASEYWSPKAHPRSARSGRAWWNAVLIFMGLVLVASNGLHFLIAWELFAVSGYFLITLERHRSEVRKAGWLYLAASHTGTLCLFAFFICLSVRLGTWDLGPMRQYPELAPLFWLALAGFGLKAGLFPLHIWLPSAHANAPSHVSALLSGVAIKMGIYGLVRFTGWLPVPNSAGWVIGALGVASAVLGVAFALAQHDLKRLLAYHSVENIGIILIGLGFAMIADANGHPAWGQLALFGGMLHVWNHGLFKGLLFLGAGSVLHATGTRHMSSLGGLWRSMPWTAGCFALGAAAISGLPPLNGFVSEWLVYLGLFGAVDARGMAAIGAVPAAILLAVTGALALACFVKVTGVVFLGFPRSDKARHAHESGWRMRIAMLGLAIPCVVIGLAPALVWPVLRQVSAAWQGGGESVPVAPPVPILALGFWNLIVAILGIGAVALVWKRVRGNGLKRSLTWDCGYAAPTARMQYTAGSFAGIITEWFAWILRPERHVERPVRSGAPLEVINPPSASTPDVERDARVEPFPSRASFIEHTPETVLERVIEPFARGILGVSTVVRRLQHGRLQFYILYLIIGLAALALLAFLGGAS